MPAFKFNICLTIGVGLDDRRRNDQFELSPYVQTDQLLLTCVPQEANHLLLILPSSPHLWLPEIKVMSQSINPSVKLMNVGPQLKETFS